MAIGWMRKSAMRIIRAVIQDWGRSINSVIRSIDSEALNRNSVAKAARAKSIIQSHVPDFRELLTTGYRSEKGVSAFIAAAFSLLRHRVRRPCQCFDCQTDNDTGFAGIRQCSHRFWRGAFFLGIF